MNHLRIISNSSNQHTGRLLDKLTGKFYTGHKLSKLLIPKFIDLIKESLIEREEISILDPFSGDGRLITSFIEQWNKMGLPVIHWSIELWDIDNNGHEVAKTKLEELISAGHFIEYSFKTVDTFKYAKSYHTKFDIVVTNPPWEILKPDSRELKSVSPLDKTIYIDSLKEFDSFLASNYPLSQPQKKFAGWGTNLSRVGLEVSLSLIKTDGEALIILPASFFADNQSIEIRKDLFLNTQVRSLYFFPAKAKLFGKADIDSSTIFISKKEKSTTSFSFERYDDDLTIRSIDKFNLSDIISNNDFIIPININSRSLKILNKLQSIHSNMGLYEGEGIKNTWIGRELDETKIDLYLNENENGPRFIRGRMIDRFHTRDVTKKYFHNQSQRIPPSVDVEKIVWRDISRTTQKRRIIATIIPKHCITGNSLGVLYYKDGDPKALRILLGVINSICFEFQIRNHLATGHVSLSAMRKGCIPDRSEFEKDDYNIIYQLVLSALRGDADAEYELEGVVAQIVYRLTKEEFSILLSSFDKISTEEKEKYLSYYAR